MWCLLSVKEDYLPPALNAPTEIYFGMVNTTESAGYVAGDAVTFTYHAKEYMGHLVAVGHTAKGHAYWWYIMIGDSILRFPFRAIQPLVTDHVTLGKLSNHINQHCKQWQEHPLCVSSAFVITHTV